MNNRGGSTRQWRMLRAWWANQLPLPCARCHQLVHASDDWHLDHQVPLAEGGADSTARPAHAACNLTAGGRLGLQRAAESLARNPRPIRPPAAQARQGVPTHQAPLW